MNRYCIIIIQSLLLINDTKESRIKLGMMAFKAIGKTLKNPLIKTIGSPVKDSMNMLRQNKNTIKNIASSFGEKYLGTGHNFGSGPLKHFVEQGIRKFRQNPQLAGEGPQFIRTESKTSGQMNTVFMMGRNSKNYAVNNAKRQKHRKDARKVLLKKKTLSQIAADNGVVSGKKESFNWFDTYKSWKDGSWKKRLITGVVYYELFALADFLSQYILEDRGFRRTYQYDYMRTMKFSLIGGFLGGPAMMNHFNKFLPALMNLKALKRFGYWPKTAMCLLVDQTIWAYTYNAGFLYQLNFFQYFDFEKAWDHQANLMPDVLKTNWKYFPALQAINFGFVPPSYRLPIYTAQSLFWNIYLSNKNQGETSDSGMQIRKIN